MVKCNGRPADLCPGGEYHFVGAGDHNIGDGSGQSSKCCSKRPTATRMNMHATRSAIVLPTKTTWVSRGRVSIYLEFANILGTKPDSVPESP